MTTGSGDVWRPDEADLIRMAFLEGRQTGPITISVVLTVLCLTIFACEFKKRKDEFQPLSLRVAVWLSAIVTCWTPWFFQGAGPLAERPFLEACAAVDLRLDAHWTAHASREVGFTEGAKDFVRFHFSALWGTVLVALFVGLTFLARRFDRGFRPVPRLVTKELRFLALGVSGTGLVFAVACYGRAEKTMGHLSGEAGSLTENLTFSEAQKVERALLAEGRSERIAVGEQVEVSTALCGYAPESPLEDIVGCHAAWRRQRSAGGLPPSAAQHLLGAFEGTTFLLAESANKLILRPVMDQEAEITLPENTLTYSSDHMPTFSPTERAGQYVLVVPGEAEERNVFLVAGRGINLKQEYCPEQLWSLLRPPGANWIYLAATLFMVMIAHLNSWRRGELQGGGTSHRDVLVLGLALLSLGGGATLVSWLLPFS